MGKIDRISNDGFSSVAFVQFRRNDFFVRPSAPAHNSRPPGFFIERAVGFFQNRPYVSRISKILDSRIW